MCWYCVYCTYFISATGLQLYACCWLFQSLRSCVSEVIQAIDNQLSKQDDLQKKKVCYPSFSLALSFNHNLYSSLNSIYSLKCSVKVNSLSSSFYYHHPSGVCIEVNSGGALSGEDREDPSLTEPQRI